MSDPTPSSGKPRRLGRGLSSLIEVPAKPYIPDKIQTNSHQAELTSKVSEQPIAVLISVASITPSRHQPRKHFDEARLKELADSMRTHGVLQPIVVRRTAAGGFELIAGERRWRAAKLAGITEIPAVVRVLDERASAEIAIVENLQREDLSPLERARAFSALAEQFSLSHQQVAERVGVDRATVSNTLRLLELEPEIADMVQSGRLSQGHAKALLSVHGSAERVRLAQQCSREGWSVRETERRCSGQRDSVTASSHGAGVPADGGSSEVIRLDLERRLSSVLGTRVEVRTSRSGTSGKLVLSFFDLEQLDGLLRRLGVEAET